jgi:hypothetical protein
MTYDLYKKNMYWSGFVRNQVHKVSSSDWRLVEMFASKYPILHARYMRTDYRKPMPERV